MGAGLALDTFPDPLREAARTCSRTNCGWTTYQAAQLMLTAQHEAVAQRKERHDA